MPNSSSSSMNAPHLIGTNTLLYGDVGSGKTSSLPSFIAAGIKHDLPLQLCVLITEPGGVETLLDGMEFHAKAVKMKCLPMDRLHYAYIPPASTSFQALTKTAEKMNVMGYKDLAEQKSGLEKQRHKQLIDMLALMANFIDQNGESLGSVDELDNNWLFAIDSLSGLNRMALKLHVGLKPSPHQGEWGAAMSLEENIIEQITATTNCFTALLAHPSKEMDVLIGKPQFMPDFLGNKLDSKVPRIFSDVILQDKSESKFLWSTVRRNYVLKARNLPLADNLPPSFEQIVETWLKRKRMVSASTETA